MLGNTSKRDDTLLAAHAAGAAMHQFKLNKRRLKCPCGCNVMIPEMTGAAVVDVTDGAAPPEFVPTGSRFACLDCKRIVALDQKEGRWYMVDEKALDKPREYVELERL